MKKILVLLSIVMCILLCSCDGESSLNSQDGSPIVEVQVESISVDDVQDTNALEDLITETTSNDGKLQETDELQEDSSRYEIGWVSGSIVNFRRTPETSGEVITQLKRGTEILKIKEEGEWIYISYEETKGYIHSDYVSDYPPINSIDGEVYIIVKKMERLLELWQGETLIGSFSIGLGWEPEGHKQVEGDGKTPEGEYYVCVRNSNSSFYLSLGVSYPNKEDAAAALADGRIDNNTYERIANAIDNGQCPDWNTALGGAIMIHGCGGSSDWTVGCVAVDNDVMDLLFEYCPIGTKITILP